MAKAKKNKESKVSKNTSSKKAKNSLDVAKETIRKKYGDIYGKLSDIDDRIPTISSGFLGLDLALGRGGFAKGRVYEVYGPPSGGKTTLTMSVISEAQRRGFKCVFCDAEHSADKKLFAAMGVDTEALDIIHGLTGDANLDALELYLKTGEFAVAVVDSVSALIPQAEADADIEKEFMGLHARLMSKAMRRFVPIVSNFNILLIFVNQVRYKINSFGDPTTTTGGESLNFYSTGRISVSGGEFKKSRIVEDISGEVVGHMTTFEIRKNKLSSPFSKAHIPLIYGKGYDLGWEVLNMSVDLGLIDKLGSWFSYNGEKLGQGEDNVKELLIENKSLYNELRDKIIEMTNLKQYYEQNS